MHLIRRFAVLLLLAAPLPAAPALAADTDFARFPFSTEAGEYRDLVFYPTDGRDLRIVFPRVAVERPSRSRAILRPGGDGRVTVETRDGRRGFVKGADLYFGRAPVILSIAGDQLDMRLSLRALALPLIAGPEGAVGRVAFDGMLASVSIPTRPSPAPRKATFSLKAAGIMGDAVLFGPDAVDQPTLKAGKVDIAGALDLRIPEAPGRTGTIFDAVTRARLDRGSIEMLDGRLSATGVAAFRPGTDEPVESVDGTVALDRFSTMVQRLMLTGILAPRQVFPLAALAGSLGSLSPQGTLSFDVETTPGGTFVVNGKPLVPPTR